MNTEPRESGQAVKPGRRFGSDGTNPGVVGSIGFTYLEGGPGGLEAESEVTKRTGESLILIESARP